MRAMIISASAAVITFASACSAAAHPGGGHATARPPGPQITVAQAQNVFAAFLVQYEKIWVAGDAGVAGQIATGEQAAADQYFARYDHVDPVTGKAPATPLVLAQPKVFVPRLSAYPHWFVADGLETQNPYARDYFVLSQAAPGARWREALHVTYYSRDAATDPVPAIATDAQGYATALTQGDLSLAATPAEVAIQQADLMGGGEPRSPFDFKQQLFQAGDMAHQWITAGRITIRDEHKHGWNVTYSYLPSSAQIYALRTANDSSGTWTGGAAMWYAIDETDTYTAVSPAARIARALASQAADYTLPLDVARASNLTHVTAGTRVTAIAADVCVTAVQRAGGVVDVLWLQLRGKTATAATQ